MASQALPGHPAHHFNSRFSAASGTLQARLHNFVKHALLQQLVPPGSTVCDLYCGQGTDIGKWAQAQIGRYVGVDIAASTLEEAREQWNNLDRPYSADFCEVDPSSVNLETELRYMGLPADFVTCMGRLQDSFLKEEMVRSLLQNVASILKPGGYFFGITADSSTIWSKFQKAVEGAHRAGVFRVLPRVHSEHYTISFEDDRFTPFGTRYTLQFGDGVIFEGQQLIHFPSFIRLAEEVGLECIELQNLQEFFDDYRLHFPDLLRATCANLVDPKGRLPQFAHDILSLYTTFIFKKAEYLDPDFMLSPFPPPDEEQLELCSEDASDGNRAFSQEHFSPPVEMNIGPKILLTTFQHGEAREVCVVRPEEEQRPHFTDFQEEEDMQISPKEDDSKDVIILNSSFNQPDSEGCEEAKLDSEVAAVNVMTTSGRGDSEMQTSDRSLELPDVAMIEASCDVQADEDYKHLTTCREGQVRSELASEQSNINTGSPPSNVKHDDATDQATNPQQLANVGDEEMREASTTVDVLIEEISKEQKEQSTPGSVNVEENVSKEGKAHASLSSEDSPKLTDISPPPPPFPQDSPAVAAKDTGITDLEVKECKAEKAANQQSEDVKNETPKEQEMHVDLHKISSPATGLGTADDSKPSAKARANPAAREEAYNGFNKRLNSGSEPHYRTSRPHHYHHLSHPEERQDHSHGSRHHSHLSHKVSRDRVGDHRSEHSSPTQRGESRRGRGRSRSNVASAHPSPAFVPFSHFVPQTEFPIFHSPNTPGILGPGPAPVLLIEPICPLWPIPPPLERRVFPKTRTPRKHGNDRDSSGGRSRRESPKRLWKDSPPPGTES